MCALVQKRLCAIAILIARPVARLFNALLLFLLSILFIFLATTILGDFITSVIAVYGGALLVFALAVGFGLLVAADLVFVFTTDIAGVAVGVALWGLHMGLTQGLPATLVADTAPPELRGTAYGMFNLLSGLALLVASVLAGALWESVGPQSTFLAGAVFTVLALTGLAATRRIAPAVGQRVKSE